MAKNILVINVDIRETRVALIENGIIAELHMERHGARGTLGNIYLGKVSRVLPGMQAAFIDIGQERAAFLHVEDLIRPDDFESYLAGRRSGSRSDSSERADDGSGHVADDAEASGEAEVDVVDEAAEAHEAAFEAQEAEEGIAPSGDEEGAAAEDEAEEEAVHADSDEEGDEAALTDDEPAEGSAEEDPAEDDQVDDDADEGADEDSAEDAEARDSDAGDAEAADEEEEQDEEDEEDAVAAAAEEDATAETDDEGEALEAASSEDATVEGEGTAEGASVEGAERSTLVSTEEDPALTATRARTRRGGRGRRRRGKTRPDGAEGTAAAEAAPRDAAPVEAAPRAQREPREGRAPREGRGRDRGAPQAETKPAAPAARNDRGSNDRSAKGRDRGNDRRGRQGRDDRRPGREGRDSRDRRQGQGARGSGRTKDPLRVSKSTPIRDVVREGQEVIVQVSKEPIGTKGARVTSHISLPGRYVVYLPTVEHIGISKRIGSDKERSRLREAIEAMKPPQGGLIVRTLAEGLTKKSLKADVGYLVRLWGEIAKKREMTERAPNNLYAELDLVLKTARDLFTDDIEKIVIDSRDEYLRLRRFVEMFMPDRVDAIELYEGEEPIFDAYGIEDEIGRALSRKVPLTSGGHLIIDQAEALTAIDVNTGRFVGRGSKDLEDTILQTNLEAVEEIAYQLRFRNIGGLIILDLIDMERASNREKVRRKLETLLAKDKAKTTLNRISDLGLIEMTRKRTRESLGRIMNEPCFYCDGTGNLQSRQTIAYEILRQIKRERGSLRGYSVVVNAHPAVVDFLKNEERTAVIEAEKRYMRRIELMARKEYHLEQFDLVGK